MWLACRHCILEIVLEAMVMHSTWSSKSPETPPKGDYYDEEQKQYIMLDVKEFRKRYSDRNKTTLIQ